MHYPETVERHHLDELIKPIPDFPKGLSVKTRRTLTPARGMINGLNLQHFPGLGRGSRSAPILPPRIMPVFALKSAR
jgi:hypothetical protein